MIPITQTRLHVPEQDSNGNCLAAVVASILEIDIESIPEMYQDNWMEDLNTFLLPYNLGYLTVECPNGFPSCLSSLTYHEIYGNTDRFEDVLHACVGQGGKHVHDPHPEGTGLTKILGYGFIVLDPSKPSGKLALGNLNSLGNSVSYLEFGS